MVHFFASCLITGTAGGFLQGMLGVGIGLLVVPILTMLLPFHDVPQTLAIHSAIATSMAVITITSMASGINHWRQQNIVWGIIKRMMFFSLLGGFCGALIASHLSNIVLERLFSFFMLAIALRMYYQKHQSTHGESMNSRNISLPLLMVMGFGVGAFSCILGVTGSVLMVPFLRSQHLAMRYAVGTSTLIALPVMMLGSVVYFVVGWHAHLSIPSMYGFIYLPALVFISITGFVFAFLGTQMTAIVSGDKLQKFFSVILALMGLKMLI